MGDRTPIEVRVYSCPPEKVDQVLEVFEEFGLGNEFILPGEPRNAFDNSDVSLELGRGYIRSEISVGTSQEIAAALPSEAAWKVWEDPAYDHLGQVHLNHPDLGEFVADCDAQGNPMWTSDDVDRLVERTDGDRVQLGHLTGRTWEIAFGPLYEVNKGIILPRDPGAGSVPLQAAALNQVAAGPPRWMPEDAPGQARADPSPDR